MAWILGLTGGIASGKTKVANHFALLGAHLVDADEIARAVIAPDSSALNSIVQYFGPDIIRAGELDRAQLRKKIFASPQAKAWLEGLLHPLIRATITKELNTPRSAAYVILVAPLLFENSLHTLTARTLVVDAPEDLQLRRALARDGSERATIESIIAAQMPRQQRLALADDTLDNSGSWQQTLQAIEVLHQHYIQYAAHHDAIHSIHTLPDMQKASSNDG